MDTLWESLEELLDTEGNHNYEVEYSVRCDYGPHGCLMAHYSHTRAGC